MLSMEAGTSRNDCSLMQMNGQVISATTNVPVHYIALTDLMNNRATAETLYDVILHGCALERNRLKDYLRDIYLQAQALYIDKIPGSDLSKIIDKFEIPLEVVDKSRFKELVEAYSIAYGDGIISADTYRKVVPNINPQTEKSMAETEKLNKFKDFIPENEVNTQGAE